VPLSPYTRERILARLDAMTDERAFQVLDYIEFLDSKYARREPPTGVPGLIAKLQETVEDGLRAGKVSAGTVAETLGFMQKAVNVVSGVAAAGQSVASDLAGVASRAAQEVARAGSNGAASTGTSANGSSATVSTAAVPDATVATAAPTGTAPAAQSPVSDTSVPPAAASTSQPTAAPVEGPPPPRNWWEQ
jgi:hypothetical protein